MAEKLPRVTAKIFASNAAEDDIGQYGSALAGNKVLTSDISEIQALPAYETGWRGAVLSTRNYPTLQEMNGLQKTFSQQIAYLLETGLPEWDENTTYWANTSFCQFDGKIYQSLTDNNIGNNPTTDTTNWQYINFNGANQDLSNLSDLGIDFINQSKALETGQVSDNPIVYADIEKAYHSSFDLEKFTLVGSPIITADGIASNFNSGNRIATTILDVTKENYCIKLSNFEYKGGQTFVFGTPFTQNSNSMDIIFNQGKIAVYLSSNGSTNDIANYTLSNSTFTPNIEYDISFIRENGNKYKVVVYNHSTNIETTEIEIDTELDLFNANTPILLGSIGGAWQYYTGSIDLKQFSVTVDGAVVFSGNKTGIDTIKPDNYTVVGEPTITEDGIASGFGHPNFLQTTISPTSLIGHSFRIESPVRKSFDYTDEIIGGGEYGFSGEIGLRYNSALIRVGNAEENSVVTVSNSELITTAVQSAVEVDNSAKTITLFYKITPNGEWLLGDKKSFVGLMYSAHYSLLLNIGRFYNIASQPTKFDLNTCKIYVDGKLVYQPCLKIPYTLSHGGAKIADMQYLERVQDAYEQGFTEYSYFTIDEQNQKFTLPQGIVYEGFAEQVNLRGMQTITGQKTFTNAIKLQNLQTSQINLKSETFDSANKAAEQYYGIIDFSDKNNVQTGRVDNWNISPTSIVTRMSAFNPVSNARGDVYICANDNGETYATAPTPSNTTDKSVKIATTEWVQNYGKPNLSAAITIPYNTDYTCTTNGWIFFGASVKATAVGGSIQSSTLSVPESIN